ncbi:MAG: hypothetical protein GAK39_03624 [Variovorax sp.]|nr:MAG: hypothetical protein GAK39_03624 [Variovorax sp.]
MQAVLALSVLWALFLGLLPGAARAQDQADREPGLQQGPEGAGCRISKNAHRLALTQRHEFNGIRVFYALEGPHALYTGVDLNGNGVPDMVEDAALHLDTVRRIYLANGFRDPLRSPRFRQAETIDIDLLNFDAYSPGVADKRGLSFSAVIRYPGSSARADRCTLSIAINAALAGNHERVKDYLIPHELFHLFQYGHAMFRASWYLEGMAKWAEWVTLAENRRNPTLWSTPLPATPTELRARVFANPNPYDVRHFWNRLAELAKAGEPPMAMPDELRARRFADGSPVVRDEIWRGHALMLRILQAFGEETEAVARERGLPPYQWPDADQRDTAHNPRLMRVVQRALAASGVRHNDEIARFLAIDPAAANQN